MKGNKTTSKKRFGSLVLPIKFYGKKEHAEKFMGGHLYANRIGYFRAIEEDSQRSDPDEGWVQQEGGKLTLGVEGGEQHPIEVEEPIKIDYGHTSPHFSHFCPFLL